MNNPTISNTMVNVILNGVKNLFLVKVSVGSGSVCSVSVSSISVSSISVGSGQ